MSNPVSLCPIQLPSSRPAISNIKEMKGHSQGQQKQKVPRINPKKTFKKFIAKTVVISEEHGRRSKQMLVYYKDISSPQVKL